MSWSTGPPPRGVVAAVSASREGKSAVIVEPGRHVGGMVSVIIGNDPDIFTGLQCGLANGLDQRMASKIILL